MESASSNFNELLNEAESNLKTADHLTYITYSLIKENTIIKKVIDNLYLSCDKIIKAVLNYEKLHKRIRTEKSDIDAFQQCASRFNIAVQEFNELKEIIILAKKRQESAMEFIRKDKLVIMSNNLKTESIGLEQLKKYLNILKLVLNKIRVKIAQEKSNFRYLYK